ncbi:hypothetical protein BDV27DRAFT_109842 [Aspergillus caelatus]|uniref:Uncharacterized protein n=1 Tax=Aspergillus caelatus TaxID=61420 RepID=A0A5N7A588_9EURO|nr:uncharacterized protein BDV27DRAFT_109842 [Aspergillus caelatus]KAE8364855.1 hypothetical protein BDV27DRAFT_109842 [Aspergillus caelatus]
MLKKSIRSAWCNLYIFSSHFRFHRQLSDCITCMTLPCHLLFILIYLSCTALLFQLRSSGNSRFLFFFFFFFFDFHSTLMFPSSWAEASSCKAHPPLCISLS